MTPAAPIAEFMTHDPGRFKVLNGLCGVLVPMSYTTPSTLFAKTRADEDSRSGQPCGAAPPHRPGVLLPSGALRAPTIAFLLERVRPSGQPSSRRADPRRISTRLEPGSNEAVRR